MHGLIRCHPNLDLDLENVLMTDINYHLYLQGKSVKNFMKWLDLQIFVKECKHKVLKICILPSLIIGKEPAGVAQTCSVKRLFLEISQNSQENTCARVA